MDVVAVIDERADQTRRRALDAPVEDERARNNEELHWSDDLEAGLDRGWPEIEATRLRTVIFIAARPRAPGWRTRAEPDGFTSTGRSSRAATRLVASSAF